MSKTDRLRDISGRAAATAIAEPAGLSASRARAEGAVLLAASLGAIAAPRAMPAFLTALAIMAALVLMRERRRLVEAWPGHALAGALAALAGYVLVHIAPTHVTGWPVSPEATGKALLFAVTLIGTGLAVGWLASEPSRLRLHFLGQGLLIGFAIGLGLLLFEVVTHLALTRFVLNIVPAFRPASAKHVSVVHGMVTSVGPYILNRNVAVVTLLIWPALLIARDWPASRPGIRRLVPATLVSATAIAALLSEHETSKLALPAGLLVLALCRAAPRLGRGLVLAGWITAWLAVVPAALLAYQAGLYEAPWLQETARARIVLWGTTARLTLDAPILGAGIKAAREHDRLYGETAPRPPGFPYAIRTGRHAHNVYLQTWFELGALGVLLFLVAGIALLTRLARLAPEIQPYAYANFAAVMVMAAFSWGLWQAWFLALFGFTAVMMALAARTACAIRSIRC